MRKLNNKWGKNVKSENRRKKSFEHAFDFILHNFIIQMQFQWNLWAFNLRFTQLEDVFQKHSFLFCFNFL